MNDQVIISVPDIGESASVEIIEILVKAGEVIEKDTPLIVLESEKASMEIPADKAGKIDKIMVEVGQTVSKGDAIVQLELNHPDTEDTTKEDDSKAALAEKSKDHQNKPQTVTQDSSKPEQTVEISVKQVTVPDIGEAAAVEVIEVLVKAGDDVQKDQALVTLEGDKATMDIPCPYTGKVEAVQLSVGDKVSKGSIILSLKIDDLIEQGVKENNQPSQNNEASGTTEISQNNHQISQEKVNIPERSSEFQTNVVDKPVYAGPAVRKMARELGVDLTQLSGTGNQNRISKEDVQIFIKNRLNQSNSHVSNFAGTFVNFGQFGLIETKPLTKIKQLTGLNVHRAWMTIPHVTQFDRADITDLEQFRKAEIARDSSTKLTLLAFVTKILAKVLQQYPQFNASLDSTGKQLIYKQYYNIGIAVETPQGLVVPVIKKVDTLSVKEIAEEMVRLSQKAREKGLDKADMSGGCFTISSLGGIGGTYFTPIVNGPEVAILGLSRASIEAVYCGENFEPRLMLPLSLSYDHRVIDGAEGARFTKAMVQMLEDVRKIIL